MNNKYYIVLYGHTMQNVAIIQNYIPPGFLGTKGMSGKELIKKMFIYSKKGYQFRLELR